MQLKWSRPHHGVTHLNHKKLFLSSVTEYNKEFCVAHFSKRRKDKYGNYSVEGFNPQVETFTGENSLTRAKAWCEEKAESIIKSVGE